MDRFSVLVACFRAQSALFFILEFGNMKMGVGRVWSKALYVLVDMARIGVLEGWMVFRISG